MNRVARERIMETEDIIGGGGHSSKRRKYSRGSSNNNSTNELINDRANSSENVVVVDNTTISNGDSISRRRRNKKKICRHDEQHPFLQRADSGGDRRRKKILHRDSRHPFLQRTVDSDLGGGSSDSGSNVRRKSRLYANFRQLLEDESSRRKRHQSAAGINGNAKNALGSSKVGGEVKEVVGLDVDGKDGDGEKNDASAAAIFNSTSRNKEGVDVDDVLPKPPSSTNSDKVNVQGVEGGKDAADSTAGGALNDVGTGGGGDLKDDDKMMDSPPTEKDVENMEVEDIVGDLLSFTSKEIEQRATAGICRLQALVRGRVAREVVEAMREELEETQRQEVVQSVELIVRQLLDLNGFSTDDEGYNLTAQDILEEYDECGGDPMALIDHFADDIRWNNGIELKDWKDMSYVLRYLRLTTKEGPNSTFESLPSWIRNREDSDEVEEFCRSHPLWNDIENAVDALGNRAVHRTSPISSKAPIDQVWGLVIGNFEPIYGHSLLELDEHGWPKHRCLRRFFQFLVNLAVENGYNGERALPLLLRSFAHGNHCLITGPSDWNKNKDTVAKFDDTCYKTSKATKTIHQDLLAETSIKKKIVVVGEKPCKNIIQGGGVFGKSWLTKEQHEDCLLQGRFDRLCHFERMTNTLTEAEQKLWGKVARELLSYAFGNDDFKATKKMLDTKGVLPCMSNATKKKSADVLSKTYQNKSEEEKKRHRTNQAIAHSMRLGNTNPFVFWKCMNDGEWGKAGEHCGYETERQLPTKRPRFTCPWCKTRDGLTRDPERKCDQGLTRNQRGNFGFLRCSCPQCDSPEGGDWISKECQERMNEEQEEGEEE